MMIMLMFEPVVAWVRVLMGWLMAVSVMPVVIFVMLRDL